MTPEGGGPRGPVEGPTGPAAAFTEAMARLASAVAVVTARQSDGTPCGLLVSSVCSYSMAPPSVLFTVTEGSRSHRALTGCTGFGVHLLSGANTRLAELFASRGTDKFAHTRWSWDGTVPRLPEAGGYLRCAPTAVFQHGDHAVVIGEVEHCRVEAVEPLVYFRRRLGWRLTPDDGPALTPSATRPADPRPDPRPEPRIGDTPIPLHQLLRALAMNHRPPGAS